MIKANKWKTFVYCFSAFSKEQHVFAGYNINGISVADSHDWNRCTRNRELLVQDGDIEEYYGLLTGIIELHFFVEGVYNYFFCMQGWEYNKNSGSSHQYELSIISSLYLVSILKYSMLYSGVKENKICKFWMLFFLTRKKDNTFMHSESYMFIQYYIMIQAT